LIRLLILLFYAPSLLAQDIDLIDYNYNSFVSHVDEYHWISSKGGWNQIGGYKSKKYHFTSKDLKGSYIQSPMTYDGKILDFGYRIIDIDTFSNNLFLRVKNSIYSYNYKTKKIDRLSSNTQAVSYTKINNSDDRVSIIGNLWLNGEGIEIFDSNWNLKHISFKNCLDVSSEVSDVILNNGKYWIISRHEIIELDISNPCLSKVYYSPFKSSLSYAVFYQGSLIVSSESDGLLEFETKTGEFRKFNHLDLSSERPVELFLDDDNYLWISYRNEKIDRVHISEIYSKRAVSKFGRTNFSFSKGDSIIHIVRLIR